MLNECWAPWHTGPRGAGYDADEWVSLDSIVMGPGPRSARHTSFRATELLDIIVCPACLAHPSGVGLAELFADPSARPVGGSNGTEPDICTVTCMSHRPNRRRLLRIKARKGPAYCPGCGGNAHIDVYQGVSRPRWRDVLRESWYAEQERREELHETRINSANTRGNGGELARNARRLIPQRWRLVRAERTLIPARDDDQEAEQEQRSLHQTTP